MTTARIALLRPAETPAGVGMAFTPATTVAPPAPHLTVAGLDPLRIRSLAGTKGTILTDAGVPARPLIAAHRPTRRMS